MGARNRKIQECCPPPVECMAAYVSKKWTISIIVAIGTYRRMRFNQLKEHLQFISAKMLSQRLDELEEKGLIVREVIPGKPPGSEYRLTKDGALFFNAVKALTKWAEGCKPR